MSPSQKLGTDSPSSASALATHSAGRPRRTAATTPAPTPSSGGERDRQQRQLDRHRQRGAQHRGDARPRCGSRCPRSPCSALLTNCQNCTGSGWSRPYCCRIAAERLRRAVLPGQGEGRVAGEGAHAEEHHDRGQQQRDQPTARRG